MRFEVTPINGCVQIDIEPHVDSRGMFARTWCSREFEAANLPSQFVQCSVARNLVKGTLRGMHFQRPPSHEGKLVRCTRGMIYDVVIDIRHESATFMRQVSVTLTAENGRALYVPPGCAHGYQTLEDDTDVSYQMTSYYEPELGHGFRWNDGATDIEWPLADPVINERDRHYADLDLDWLRSLAWN